MSQTWLAETRRAPHQAEGQRVVLKIARRDQTEHYRANQLAISNEERWLRRLHNEGHQAGIVQLLPVVYTGNRPAYSAKTGDLGEPRFIVLNYLAGGSLRQLLDAQRPLSVHLALLIAYRLALVLGDIHRHGCVHMDIKPDNIMFRHMLHRAPKDAPPQSPVPEPVLIDFGIAQSENEMQYIGGVDAWLAPECEQAKDEHARIAIRASMDIFPLGLVLYYMLTGQRVGNKRTCPPITPNLLRWETTPTVRLPTAFARQLDDLVQKMTDPTPSERPSAVLVAQELDELRKMAGPRAAPPVSQPRSAWARPLILAIIPLILVALFALILRFQLPGGDLLPFIFPQGTEVAEAATSTAAVTPPSPTPDEPIATQAITPIVGGAVITTTAATATPLPTASTEPTATREPTETRVPTPTATAIAPPRPLIAANTPAGFDSRCRVVLQTPAHDSAHSGTVIFSWIPNDYCTNVRYEVAIWSLAEFPNRNDAARGPAPAGNYTSVEVHLDVHHATYPSSLPRDAPSQWAVRIVISDTPSEWPWVSEAWTIRYNGN